MDDKQAWGTKKLELLNNIDKTIESGNVDTEVLEIMKELLEVTNVKISISEYFNDS